MFIDDVLVDDENLKKIKEFILPQALTYITNSVESIKNFVSLAERLTNSDLEDLPESERDFKRNYDVVMPLINKNHATHIGRIVDLSGQYSILLLALNQYEKFCIPPTVLYEKMALTLSTTILEKSKNLLEIMMKIDKENSEED